MKGVTPKMKKSHEYDSPVLSRLVSVVTVLAICVCSVCCVVSASKIAAISGGTVAVNNGGDSQGNNPSPSDNKGTPSDNQSNTQTPGDNNGDNPAPADDNNPSGGPTNEEILAKYTEVMNNLKSGVASYEKKEFQKLADDYDMGTVGNMVLPIANNIMTSEEKAEIQKRDDAAQIPVINNDKGCLLTDASKIEKATMTEDGGKTTIVLTLKDEKGSLPVAAGATSSEYAVGAVFNPLDKKGIDDIVAKFAGIADIKSFELSYNQCTATLVFDTASGHVESLEQIMNVYITVDAKVAKIMSLSGYATLINTMRINNVAYK